MIVIGIWLIDFACKLLSPHLLISHKIWLNSTKYCKHVSFIKKLWSWKAGDAENILVTFLLLIQFFKLWINLPKLSALKQMHRKAEKQAIAFTLVTLRTHCNNNENEPIHAWFWLCEYNNWIFHIFKYFAYRSQNSKWFRALCKVANFKWIESFQKVYAGA